MRRKVLGDDPAAQAVPHGPVAETCPQDLGLAASGVPDLALIGPLVAADANLVPLAAFVDMFGLYSPAGRAALQLFAVRIDGFAARLGRGRSETRVVLTELAAAMAQVLRPYGNVAAHAGNGVFLCASNHPHPFDPHRLECDIAWVLDDRDSQRDDGQGLNLEISVGKPLHPDPRGARLEQHLAQAAARAAERARAKRTAVQAPNIRPLEAIWRAASNF